MASRRTVLVGLGGLVAGGGALIGTGAFDTVQANRTVNVQTTGDASALLGLSAFNRDDDTNNATNDSNAYVSTNGDGTIVINLDGDGTDTGASGINRRAKTVLRNLVTVTNQGTQDVESLELEFTDGPGSINLGDTFSFPVNNSAGSGTDATAENGSNVLTEDDIPNPLSPGTGFNFGIEIDLINGGGGGGDLPNGNYTLTITADSDDNTGGN